MIQIDDLILNCDLIDVLFELRNQLTSNRINLLKDIKDSGDNIMITCPYHKDGQERRPSAGIQKDTGIMHCFTCNIVKTLPELVSNCFGHDDYGVFGTQWLVKNFSTVSVENRKGIKLDFKRTDSIDNSVSSGSFQYVGEEELNKYRYYHPYMYKRKLTDKVIDMFDIGYDADTDCITFPIRDENGNCLFIARRSVKGKYFNYPSNASKPLYGLYEFYKYGVKRYYDEFNTLYRKEFPKEVILCESMLDALVFWTINKIALALNGTGSKLQIDQLRTLPVRKIILCTDNDSAGMSARKKIKSKINNKIVTEYLLPANRKDANECTEDELRTLKEVF